MVIATLLHTVVVEVLKLTLGKLQACTVITCEDVLVPVELVQVSVIVYVFPAVKVSTGVEAVLLEKATPAGEADQL